MVTPTKTKTDVEKLVDKFNQLVNERIVDFTLMFEHPYLSDTPQMRARFVARADELNWAKTNLERLTKEVLEE